MYEAAHGTVQRHYYRYLEGAKTSTNPMALIFAWSTGLRKRGELDQTPEVVKFATALEQSAVEIIENGVMTGDLFKIAAPDAHNRQVYTEDFLQTIKTLLESKLC